MAGLLVSSCYSRACWQQTVNIKQALQMQFQSIESITFFFFFLAFNVKGASSDGSWQFLRA